MNARRTKKNRRRERKKKANEGKGLRRSQIHNLALRVGGFLVSLRLNRWLSMMMYGSECAQQNQKIVESVTRCEMWLSNDTFFGRIRREIEMKNSFWSRKWQPFLGLWSVVGSDVTRISIIIPRHSICASWKATEFWRNLTNNMSSW